MKMKHVLILASVLTVTVGGFAQTESSSTAPAVSTEVMPLIVIDDAPLPDAIRNLARQAGLNFQFDPKVTEPKFDAAGKPLPPQNVTFRWENITALQALEALLDNYGLQLVQDPKTKISRVTFKDPQAQEPLIPRVITLKYSNPTNMTPVIMAAFDSGRSKVLSDPRTGQLIVLATEKEHAKIDELVSRLDSSPSQILIEARFIETSRNPKTAKGVNWRATLEAQNVLLANNVNVLDQGGKIGDPIWPGDKLAGSWPNGIWPGGTVPKISLQTDQGWGAVPGYINADGLSAVLSLMNSDSETETVATPRAVTLEGFATDLSVTRNIPVFEQETAQSQSGPTKATKPNYGITSGSGQILNEVGTKLKVTPKIYGTTNVFLDLMTEISEIESTPATQVLDGTPNSAPIFGRKKVTTQAMVPSSYTLVMGGLREDRNSKSSSKVPFLGDAPLLGGLFRHKSKEYNKRELLIFVTPSILIGEDYIPTEDSRSFLQQRPLEKSEPKWGTLDNTTPHDWTKPAK